jgi:hypothetical protein
MRNQDDDVQVLRRMLAVTAERDFPAGRRRQREEHLMTSWLQMARKQGQDRRYRLAIRVAAPMAVAAAVAGVGVTVGQVGTLADHGTTARHTAPEAGHFPERITTVAYTLAREPHGVVTMTLRDIRETSPDPERLQRLNLDLARMGVRARVYHADPNCPVTKVKTTPGDKRKDGKVAEKVVAKYQGKDGRFTASIYPDNIPEDHTLVFPVASTIGVDELVAARMVEGQGPDCWHMPAPGIRDRD